MAALGQPDGAGERLDQHGTLVIKIVRDDGLGILRDSQGLNFGTVNYETGVVQFLPDTTVRIPVTIKKK